jgi:hypothetical protein
MAALEGGTASSILGPRLIYGDNALQTGPFHSAPSLIGNAVVGEGSISLGSGSYIQFSLSGFVSGTAGVFEVGGYLTTPGTLYVVHNFFRP